MSNRRAMPVTVILLISLVCAQDRVQSELRFAAHSKDQKDCRSVGKRAIRRLCERTCR
jgi:hypothetical protein